MFCDDMIDKKEITRKIEVEKRLISNAFYYLNKGRCENPFEQRKLVA